MKSLVFNFKTLAVAGAATLVAACSDYAPDEFDGNLSQKDYETIIEYTKNFEERYGKIDPEQNWGFGELGVVDSEGKRSVRGTRGSTSTNRNIGYAGYNDIWDQNTQTNTPGISNYGDSWVNVICDEKNGGSVLDYHTKRVMRGGEYYQIKVPGFPSDVDGKFYYADKAGSQFSDIDTIKVASADEFLKLPDVRDKHIIGDVTNEEIVFVSRWFREHKNPQNESSADLKKTGDSGNVDILEAECLETIDYNTFFIQHISCDYDRENGTKGAYKRFAGGLDYLNIISSDGKSHENNFNTGNKSCNLINEKDPNSYFTNYNGRGIMLYVGDEGEHVKGFEYHNSETSSTQNKYVIMHLKFKFKSAYSTNKYDGYYLGMDYYSDKDDSRHPADGYYSNWIVKISDALPQLTPEWRIMCEDLGTTDDFDFNDLVFDVYYTTEGSHADKYTANITVQAVGGTLPIYIDTPSTDNELHKLMGGEVGKPINVGVGDKRQPLKMTIKNCDDTNPDNIAIWVRHSGEEKSGQKDIIKLPKTKAGCTPQKFCVPTTVKWMKERMQIEWGYPSFDNWVNDNKYLGPWYNETTEASREYLYNE